MGWECGGTLLHGKRLVERGDGPRSNLKEFAIKYNEVGAHFAEGREFNVR